MYDVIIIGAGPAGSLLAYLLSQKGYSNLVIEKKKLPRYKACGGGLTIKAIDQLPYKIDSVIENAASGGILTYKGHPLFKVDHKNVVAKYVMRDQFDSYLIQKATEIGTELIENVTVTNISNNSHLISVDVSGKIYISKILVGADGVNSFVAKHFGLLTDRRTGVALEAEVFVPKKSLEQQSTYALFDFGVIKNGYGWIFPKSDHFSVGVYHAKETKIKGLNQSLNAFIKCQSILQGHKIKGIKGHQIPLGGIDSVLHTSNGLLLGDAANLAEPWLGEGIYYAFRSARIAAEEIDLFLSKENYPLTHYTERINSEIVSQFKHAKTLSNLVYRFPHRLSNILSKSPIMQKAIFDNIRGDISFSHLENYLLRKIPQILIQIFKNGSNNSYEESC